MITISQEKIQQNGINRNKHRMKNIGKYGEYFFQIFNVLI